MKQLQLLKFNGNRNKTFFGGALLIGKRKGQRPLCGKKSLHVVLRSQWATNQNKFTVKENRSAIRAILNEVSKKYGVRVYGSAICGNHIHLLIRSKNRWLYRSFISVVTGAIAQHIMHGMSFKNFLVLKAKEFAGEGVPHQEKGQAFWEHRPFSRIVSWGRDYKNCVAYLGRNILEALGFIAYNPRRDYYAKSRVKRTANADSS